ncbi:hypothetical protein AB0C65_35255 [Nocardia sp. NPDC048505]|uniref:hypothetical protein n=1 Tax=Nocardia sp. NPDC048505 TaxID=3155756 RepID=UPI0033E420C9
MPDLPVPETSPEQSGDSLPEFPTLRDPTVTFTAGPDTAQSMSRVYVRYAALQPANIATMLAGAALVITLAGAAWGKGGAVLATLVALVFAWWQVDQVRRLARYLEHRFGTSTYAEGTVSSARHGAEASDFVTNTSYLRIRHADIQRLVVHEPAVFIRMGWTFHVVPRELYPEPVLRRLSESGVSVRGRFG